MKAIPYSFRKYMPLLAIFFIIAILAFIQYFTGVSADTSLSCDDGDSRTTDSALSVNDVTTCQHKFTKPVSYCYGYYPAQATTFKSSGLFNSCDIVEGTFAESTAKAFAANGIIVAQRYTDDKAQTMNGQYPSGPCSIKNFSYDPSNPGEIEDYQGCVNKVYSEVSASITNSIKAVSYDEYLFSATSEVYNQFNSAVIEGLLKVKQQYPRISVLVAGTSTAIYNNSSSEARTRNFKKMLSVSDVYLDEHYTDERDLPAMSAATSEIVTYYSNMFAKIPEMVDKTLVLLGMGDAQRWSSDQNPEVNNNYFYDLEFNEVKKLIDRKQVVGVGAFTMHAQELLTKKFYSILNNHYIKNNQSNRIIATNESFISNGAFEDGLDHWSIEGGTVSAKSYDTLKSILYAGTSSYQFRKKIPNGNSYLSMTRSEKPNIVSQPISAKSGTLYQVEAYSKKTNNNFGSDIALDVVDGSGKSVVTSRIAHDIYANLAVDASATAEPTLADCVAGYSTCTLLKNYWQKEVATFYGQDDLKLKISDTNASVGDDQVIDFVQVSPMGEGRINTILYPGFNIMNVPAISNASSVLNCGKYSSLSSSNFLVFKLNQVTQKWDYSYLDMNFIFNSGASYYIYNPGGQMELTLDYDNFSCQTEKDPIGPGWNLISNNTNTSQDIGNLFFWSKNTCTAGECVGFGSLSDYISTGKVYRYIYAIEDARTVTADKAFRTVDTKSSDRTIKPGQSFWIYLFK